MKLRNLYLIFCLLLIMPSASASSNEPLKIGLTGKYPPFNYYNGEGQLVGFDVDISNHICKELNRSCEFVVLQWDGILAALLAGKIDLIIGSMAITSEREKQALFSVPYYESGAQIFASDPKQDIEVVNFKIGVTLGTTYETIIRKRLPHAEVRTYKGDSEILQDIKIGRLDAIVTDRLVGGYMIKNFKVDLHPIGSPLELEKIGIPAKKINKNLIADINKSITTLRNSPLYNQLMQRYFGLSSNEIMTFSWTHSFLLLLKGLASTILISLCGLVLGIIFSIILALIIINGHPILQFSSKLFIDFFRSTPFLIQLLGIYFGLPVLGISISPFSAAIITMSLHSSAYLGEILVGGFYAIPKEQRYAGQLLGLSGGQITRLIVFPQMIPLISAPFLNTIVAMIKDSAIVSVISVYELTMQAQQLVSATYLPFEFYFLTALLYGCVTYPMILIGRRLDKKMQLRDGRI